MATHDYATFETPLPHPGEHLREDFLPDFGLSAGALARMMGLRDRSRIERLVREKQPITPDTALRLGKVFGTSPDFWMNLQAQHDLSVLALSLGAELNALETLAVKNPEYA